MIRAFKNLYRLIKELYSDRRLLVSLSKKDFRRKFAGSYLGVIWAFLQPALTVLVYCIVFQFAFPGSNTDGVPFVAWFLPGIVLWLFISEAISISSSAYLEYSYLVKKVAFSIGILPMVKVLSSFITHLCFVVLVEAILMAYGICLCGCVALVFDHGIFSRFRSDHFSAPSCRYVGNTDRLAYGDSFKDGTESSLSKSGVLSGGRVPGQLSGTWMVYGKTGTHIPFLERFMCSAFDRSKPLPALETSFCGCFIKRSFHGYAV